MKSVSILIPNYNSFSAIQLCVESIIHRTDYPNYKIIVHDDNSPNKVDLAYLEKAEQKGWIQLIRGNNRRRWGADKERYSPYGHPAPYWHGCSLNVLINETCKTDLAMILDCDVYIKGASWLKSMVELIDDKTLYVSNEGKPFRAGSGIYVMGWYHIAFSMLNMQAYHDGMEIDWRGGSADIRNEPYKTLIASVACEMENDPTDGFRVAWDPGGSMWIRIRTNNPKGYIAKNIPMEIEKTYQHFWQISVRIGGSLTPPTGIKYYDDIDYELCQLRKQCA